MLNNLVILLLIGINCLVANHYYKASKDLNNPHRYDDKVWFYIDVVAIILLIGLMISYL